MRYRTCPLSFYSLMQVLACIPISGTDHLLFCVLRLFKLFSTFAIPVLLYQGNQFLLLFLNTHSAIPN
jgi:hypothetical protein